MTSTKTTKRQSKKAAAAAEITDDDNITDELDVDRATAPAKKKAVKHKPVQARNTFVPCITALLRKINREMVAEGRANVRVSQDAVVMLDNRITSVIARIADVARQREMIRRKGRIPKTRAIVGHKVGAAAAAAVVVEMGFLKPHEVLQDIRRFENMISRVHVHRKNNGLSFSERRLK
jgi:hypothetical protein